MGKIKDLRGKQFGKLTVISFAYTKNGTARWNCACECGNACVVEGTQLRRGKTQSCGCLHKEITLKNLVGKRFGRLTVVELVGQREDNRALWRCSCECGGECIVSSNCLQSGQTKSCGCLLREVTIARSTIHEMSYTKIYRTWRGMLNRCNDQNNPIYGGRGIKVCDEWQKDFVAFYNHVSKLEHFEEDGYTLDRIDFNGNYEPGNLRWATPKEQARNKRTNVIVEYDGEEMTLQEAGERSGISYDILKKRWQNGIRGEGLFKPVREPLPKVEYGGEEMTLKDAAKRSGISYTTLFCRYKRGLRGAELFAK